ncbi:hypothetical protein QBC35DRAFT_456884 [Podospora australis]|uniref:RNase H type-1 domain-containing protein n=1 Tax=Podospora australis TaxID=1536484 RepID=A0AAN7AD61_9PEZI|nr:hypothetical protein QBC35DRAFT_456884 [Podospora australis]
MASALSLQTIRAVRFLPKLRALKYQIYCDASVDSSRPGGKGGIAVVHSLYRPGAPENRQQVGYAFPVDMTMGSTAAEGLAVLQAFKHAESELAFVSNLRDPSARPRKVSFKIFTDSKSIVDGLITTGTTSGSVLRKPSLTNNLITTILTAQKQLEETGAKMNMTVSSAVLYVPGHSGAYLNELANQLSVRTRKTGKPLYQVSGTVLEKSPSHHNNVFHAARSQFLAAAKSTVIPPSQSPVTKPKESTQ